ncbi:interleukin-1 beta-like [Alosa sapidissima]|uniref:interleukin-1 beta-like n=1 Tax=Alosa sapidissima TaxID=34773 RepID=UPI001C094EFC|nr:interleukin-1 beta-like [Alosa sapidissima]
MADMCFNLSDALDSYQSDCVDMDSCMHCHPMVKTSEHNVCDQQLGIDIEVADEPHNMRQWVNLVIALHRLKKTQKVQSTEFSDEELCNIFFENFVEECVTPTVHERTCQAPDHYEKTGQPVQKCYICDSLSKFLVLNEGITRELQAITLQGGNMNKRVQLELTTYLPSVPRANGRPIALGLGRNLYLSCNFTSGKPVLGIEMVRKEDLESISGDMNRFLFYKTVSGQSQTSFESAKYEGYFISTSNRNRQPVDMCQSQDAPNRLTSFMVL